MVVLELANVLAGPAVGMFFAELGARVIKVENPRTRGDVTRSWKIPAEATDSDISAYFSAVNWGKSSLAVDVATAGGRQIIYDLCRKTDIVIASYKPGDEARLRLDYPTLSGINPQIIYGQVSGYGRDDPRAGYDAILQAASGFTYMNGDPEGAPVKMPVALIDLLAAHQLKEGILLALLRRMQTGQGGYVHASLLKSGIASLANQAANWLVAGHIPERMGSEHPNIVPYGSAFRTADGRRIVLGVGNDAQFVKLCEVLGIPDVAQHPDFVTNSRRVKNRERLQSLLAARIGQFPRDALIRELDRQKVPAGGILNMQEVFEQSAARELLLSGPTAGPAPLRGVRSIAFEAIPAAPRPPLSPPPHFNAQETDILKGVLGYSSRQIARLRQQGALAKSPQD